MKKETLKLLALTSLLALLPLGVCFGADDGSILELSMEDLLNIEVTSVSKRLQSLHDAPAAIFVVTQEDIKRLGATNIADALRLVPGIHVGRIDSNKWAVTSRGFNGRFSNKLLVLVDGRNVYTTSFSGVYWEVQDPLLEDVDRIEIIRGPGSTLWGANAVNGVINIITKHAADTQGGLLVAGGGDVEKAFAALRWGTSISDGIYAKVYGKGFKRGEFSFPNGEDAGDDWDMLRGGFQINSQASANEALTLQGDIYQGRVEQQVSLTTLQPPYYLTYRDEGGKVSGGHLLGLWEKTLSSSSALSVQVYFDRAVREDPLADQATTQLDYDFQHQFAMSKHRVVWGLGYHHTNDEVAKSAVHLISEVERDFTLFSAFIQDEIELFRNRLALTIGSKIEHNDYTGFEVQPSLRFIWRANNRHRVWASVSRAVRTPSRADTEFEVLTWIEEPNSPTNPAPWPVGIFITGNEDFHSEELLAYEMGYRFANSDFSVDVTAFYNDYTSLQYNQMGEIEVRYWEDPPYIAQPAIFNNTGAAIKYGSELALAWQPRSWLRWDLAYSLLLDDAVADDFAKGNFEISPEHMVSLVFNLQPASTLNVSAGLRYVDDCLVRGVRDLEDRAVPSYTTIDARLAWHFRDDMELSLAGQNLLEENHQEYVAEFITLPTEIPRSFYAVEDRTPRVYPWLNEPGGGMLVEWKSSSPHTASIAYSTMWYGCANTAAGS